MLEALLPAFLLYPVIAPQPDLTQRKQLVAFLAFGVVLAPALTSSLASFVKDGHVSVPTGDDFFRWFTADALGIATVAPLYLAFRARDSFSGRSWREIAGLFLLLSSLTLGVFWQTRFPLLFVVMPVLLLLGMRLGLAGSALGLLLVSIVGGFLTTAGHGPIALIQSGTLAQRDLVFQAYIAINMLMLYILEVSHAESKQLQAHLQGSERRFRLLAEASSDIIALTDLDGVRSYVSPAVVEVLGWRPEEVLGGNYRDLVHPEDLGAVHRLYDQCRSGETPKALEYRCRRADGSYMWLETNPRLFLDPDSSEAAGFVNVSRNISLRKQQEEEQRRVFQTVEQLAASDALTGIANRRHFDAVLEREWRRALREQQFLSFLLIDVDRFKPYNDVYGHLTGDECLRQVVAAMKPQVARSTDLLARYGGEEFAVVLPDTDALGASRIAEWIRLAVESSGLPHPGNVPHGVITLSIGCVSWIPQEGTCEADLIEAADRALYRAKSSGRNSVQMADAFEDVTLCR